MIVFDFDKTLTQKDTIFDFFIFCSKMNKTFSYYNYIIYILFMILSKLKIISNSKLKSIGVRLFLSKINIKNFDIYVRIFSKSIKLNNEVVKILEKYPKSDIIICSASFENYIKCIFPDINVVASRLKYKKNFSLSLDRNLFKEKKKTELNRIGISMIDHLYTDSYDDISLMKISKKITLINGKNKIRLK